MYAVLMFWCGSISVKCHNKTLVYKDKDTTTKHTPKQNAKYAATPKHKNCLQCILENFKVNNIEF
jgi:hypothetical protein